MEIRDGYFEYNLLFSEVKLSLRTNDNFEKKYVKLIHEKGIAIKSDASTFEFLFVNKTSAIVVKEKKFSNFFFHM